MKEFLLYFAAGLLSNGIILSALAWIYIKNTKKQLVAIKKQQEMKISLLQQIKERKQNKEAEYQEDYDFLTGKKGIDN